MMPTPNDNGSAASRDAAFAAAEASLRRALGDLPELADASKHIMIEKTRQGLNIELVDQDGRSMFAEGAKEPYAQARRLIEAIAEPLERARYRISIVGHTAARDGQPGSWGLSVDRADSVRRILEERGYPTSNIYKVAGRGDTDPLFPDDPDAAPNRRITITLIEATPSLPPGLKP
jgi:chemotaxis protein MotB